VFKIMRMEASKALTQLMAGGGAKRNNFLLQLQAYIIGISVVPSQSSDLSALWADYLAGLAAGIWKLLDDVSGLGRPNDRFEPKKPVSQRDAVLNGWRDAIRRTLSAR
jgi:glycerol kinase